MTEAAARKAYGLNGNWRAMEVPGGQIIFSSFDNDVIVRPDGTAYELRWIITTYGHDIAHTELTPNEV